MSVSAKSKSFFNEAALVKERDEQSKLQAECLNYFDINRDSCLDLNEFGALCQDLFTAGANGPCFPEVKAIEVKHIGEIFYVFDKNKDGLIDSDEFSFCWKNWIKTIVWPVSCLLAVDVQNDFISGSLALKNCPAAENGEEIVPIINELIANVKFNFLAYSLDWHPKDHISFIDNVKSRKVHPTSKVSAEDARLYDNVIFEGPEPIEQTMWPVHCVQESWGSRFHSDLVVLPDSIVVHKGVHSDIDSYSAFFDNCKKTQTALSAELKKRAVTDVYVCGLAYDVCVGATAKDAADLGFRTILIDDASRGVTKDGVAKSRECLIEKDCIVVSSTQVDSMVKGLNRRPELAYRAALGFAN